MQRLIAAQREDMEAQLHRLYGVPAEAVSHLTFYGVDRPKVFAATVDLDPQELKLPVERIGTYFATRDDRGLRLSMDGAALVADHADPDVVLELTETEARRWLSGKALPRPPGLHRPFIILRRGEDVLGCGLVLHDRIHNRVRKSRRVPLDEDEG